LARISDTTIVLENHKTFEKNGLSPRYAAPEVFSQVRTGVFSHEVLFLILFFSFSFFF